MKFEVLEGTHFGPIPKRQGRIAGRGRKYVKGDIVDSESDLTKVFLLKFRRRKDLEGAPVAQAPVATNPPVVPAAPKQGADAGGEETPAENPLGVEVSSEFSEAKDSAIMVFKRKDGKFNVAEADRPTEALNEKPLTKAQAAKLVASLV